MKKSNACPVCSELILKNVNIVTGGVNSDIYAIMGKTVSEVLLINTGTDTITLSEYGPTSTSSYGKLSSDIIIPPMGTAKITASMMGNKWSDLWNSTIYISGFKNLGGTNLLRSLFNIDGKGDGEGSNNLGFDSTSRPLIVTNKTTTTINDNIAKIPMNCIDIYSGDIVYGSETITGVIGVFISVTHASGRSLFIGCTTNGKLLVGYRSSWIGNSIRPLKTIYQGA